MATIESLVVKISADAKSFDSTIKSLRSRLKDFGKGGALKSFAAALAEPFLEFPNVLKKLAIKRWKEFLKRLKKAVGPEIQALGAALAALFGLDQVGAGLGALEEKIINFARNAVREVTAFVETLDIGAAIQSFRDLADALGVIAASLVTIGKLITAIVKAFAVIGRPIGEFLGSAAFSVTSGAATGDKGVLDRLEKLVDVSEKEQQQSERQTRVLENLKLQQVAG